MAGTMDETMHPNARFASSTTTKMESTMTDISLVDTEQRAWNLLVGLRPKAGI
jgi:hypothetical protein